MLTKSNQQLGQQMMSINQRLQAFLQIQQASDSRFQPAFPHYSQHNGHEGEDEDEDEEDEGDDPHLGDWMGYNFSPIGSSPPWFFMEYTSYYLLLLLIAYFIPLPLLLASPSL